jgi:hypothetical protein
MMSNSACLNGGATLFFTTFTRTCVADLVLVLDRPMRRMSRRTEA